MAKGKTEELVKDTKKEIAKINLEDFAGAGFEDVQAKDLQIPFIYLIQKLSPQLDDIKPEYNPDAKAGDLFNNVTKELSKQLTVIPVYFTSAMVEWKPNRGGFVGQHKHSAEVVLKSRTITDHNGKRKVITAQGNELVDTAYVHILYKTAQETWEHAVLSFTSTQLKKSRQWLTTSQKYTMPNGRPYPMFAFTYTLDKVLESNDSGNWYGYKIERNSETPIEDDALIAKAVDTYQQIKSGIGTLAYGEESAQENPVF